MQKAYARSLEPEAAPAKDSLGEREHVVALKGDLMSVELAALQTCIEREWLVDRVHTAEQYPLSG